MCRSSQGRVWSLRLGYGYSVLDPADPLFSKCRTQRGRTTARARARTIGWGRADGPRQFGVVRVQLWPTAFGDDGDEVDSQL